MDFASQMSRLTKRMDDEVDRLSRMEPHQGTRAIDDILDYMVSGECLLGSDDDSEAVDGGADAMESVSQDDLKEGLDEGDLLDFLNSLNPVIAKKHEPQPLSAIPGMRPDRTPFHHQQTAARLALDTLEMEHKGLVIADPPGLGKTLSSLMAIATSRRPGDGPCIIVTPVSCCQQWMREIRSWFCKGKMNAAFLTGETISPIDLFMYDVVVTSYSYVASEVTRIDKFHKEMKNKKENPHGRTPKRPNITLLTQLLADNPRGIGKMLVLDEVHTIKNTESFTYAAISKLRGLFDACIMLTGTPLDNTWEDAFALISLLRGRQPIKSLEQMREAFTVMTNQEDTHKVPSPTGKFLSRITQYMDSFTLRRPQKTIAKLLPLVSVAVEIFSLPYDEMKLSDAAYKKFLSCKYINDGKCGVPGWAQLTKAQHYANHPRLVEIMQFERSGMADDPSANDEIDKHGEETIKTWRDSLLQGENWRSARVDAILRVVNRHRHRRPDDAFVIMDESVYFLEIVQMALTHSSTPIDCHAYNGRSSATERDIAMTRFTGSSGPRVLLASRGAGGVGLNLQSANVIIICSPWWKHSWEEQAIGRVYRAGQKKDVVFIYRVRADNCKVDNCKLAQCNLKNGVNDSIIASCTRHDNVQPPSRIIS